ncbi:hypothetical protein LXL04_013606 [Taraxacum kok-saghyz]
MPLQYPILFPFGEKGWALHMRQTSGGVQNGKPLTVNMYYSYVLHSRRDVYSLVLRVGRLFQQYLVDAYVCVEEDRLDFFRKNQNKFRSEFVSGVHDAISRGDSRGNNIGKRIFLPSSFVGGPRYMYKHYQDALAICRVYGNPQYFITFTCNVRWPEFERFTQQNRNQKIRDRPDLISRVFHMKVTEFIKFIREDKTFGDVTACAAISTATEQELLTASPSLSFPLVGIGIVIGIGIFQSASASSNRRHRFLPIVGIGFFYSEIDLRASSNLYLLDCFHLYLLDLPRDRSSSFFQSLQPRVGASHSLEFELSNSTCLIVSECLLESSFRKHAHSEPSCQFNLVATQFL